jgi:hypothetical protein
LDKVAQKRLVKSTKFALPLDTGKLSKVVFRVKPANSGSPQDAQSNSEIYSEVEIKFKVIN